MEKSVPWVALVSMGSVAVLTKKWIAMASVWTYKKICSIVESVDEPVLTARSAKPVNVWSLVTPNNQTAVETLVST